MCVAEVPTTAQYRDRVSVGITALNLDHVAQGFRRITSSSSASSITQCFLHRASRHTVHHLLLIIQAVAIFIPRVPILRLPVQR